MFEGRELPLRLVSYRTTDALQGRYQIHSGAMLTQNDSVDFVAVTDPIHFVVLEAAIATGVCLVLSGTAWLAEFVQAHLNSFAGDCKQRGGYLFVPRPFSSSSIPSNWNLAVTSRPEQSAAASMVWR